MGVLDLIFPKTCLECGKLGAYICDNCLYKVPEIGWHKSDVYSIWEYKGVIRKAIIALKYKFSTEIAKELSKRIVEKPSLDILENNNAILIPVPLHWRKKNLRGFNQTEEIGKLIAKEKDWEFIPDFVIKVRSTKSQVELRGKDRLDNLVQAFAINERYKNEDLKQKTIIIFDDVYTTGSTVKEVGNLIQFISRKPIIILTLAK